MSFYEGIFPSVEKITLYKDGIFVTIWYKPFFYEIIIDVACVCAQSLQSCLTFCDPPQTAICQAPLSMGFSRQEYGSGLPCPPPWDLPDPRIKLTSPMSPALQVDSLALSHRGSP